MNATHVIGVGSRTLALCTALIACTADAFAGSTVTLVADRDATLFEPQVEETASGSGEHLFAGRVNATGGGTRRRALLHFPVEVIPCGSTIITVTVTLHPTGGQATPQSVALHRCLSDWGEGASSSEGGGGAPPEPGDATWSKRFWPDIEWSVSGGFHIISPSSQAISNFSQPVDFESSPALVADVQSWVDDPTSNFGWIVIGDESTVQTTRRFASRESADPELLPVLSITFVPPSVADLNCDGRVDGNDLGALLGLWGPCAAPCAADFNGDGIVDGNDLGTLLGQWTASP